jgi:hypothetical protein
MKITTIAFLFIAMISNHIAFAQPGDCKVNLPGISDSYSGGCKNGLAQGKGIAQGTDHYEGQFVKGLPEGRGKYTWADGSYYEGQWSEGMRDGKGKMVYHDSVVNGVWLADKYIGEKLIPPYKIITALSVSRYTISKVTHVGSDVRIKIMQGGSDNVGIEDFSLIYDSGEEYKLGASYGLQNVSFPVDVKIRYRTWNQLHTAQYDVTFEFTIEQPGTWQVMISN